MKKLFIIAAVMLMCIALFSCNDDGPATPMTWEFSDYDAKEITAIYDPEIYTQVQIKTKAEYKGEITLKCTNYPVVSFLSWDTDNEIVNEECGYTITKVNTNSIKIAFIPVDLPADKNEISEFVALIGTNDKESGLTNMLIVRTNGKK